MLIVESFHFKNLNNSVNKNPISAQKKQSLNLSFTGHRVFKNEEGENVYRFYMPANQKNVTVEFGLLNNDRNGNYVLSNKLSPLFIDNKGYVDFIPADQGFDNSNPNLALGYRFKADGRIILDNSQKTTDKSNPYNIALPMNRALHNVPRQMLHIIPDSFNPPSGKDRRIHFNKFGGNLESIYSEKNGKLDYIKEMGFKRILSTPIFGQDNVSSHGYWTTNPYQITEGFGTLADFKNMQIELFKRGIGWIADGAFVNEGAEGIHIKDIMLWGKDSPYLQWFETHNIGDEPINFGILPKQKEAYDYIGIKIVNGPYKIEFKPAKNGKYTEEVTKNDDHNRFAPTFIQTFDSRLASKEQMNNSENFFRAYENKNPKDKNQINNYKDSIQPYTFRVNPDELSANYKKYSEIKKVSTNPNNVKFADFLDTWSNFKLLPSNKDGGVSLWVGNKDISKFRFMVTDESLENSGINPEGAEARKIKAAQYQVQDNIVQVGKFWTSETARTLIENTAKKLAGNSTEKDFEETIQKLIEKNELPQTAKNILQKGENGSPLSNVLANWYNLKSIPAPENITDGLMSYPLDAIEFAPDLTSVLGSPYIKKLSPTEDGIQLSRYRASQADYYSKIPEEYRDLYKKTDNIYKNEMSEQAVKILKRLEDKLSVKFLNANGELTNEGKDLYALIASDIAKFLVVSALAPKVEPDKDAEFLKYDTGELAKINSISLGLYNGANSPKDVAERLINKLSNGLKNIDKGVENDFVESLAKRLKNIDIKALAVSKLIIDTTESGLEWRIDAAKDVGDWESVSTGAMTREECWNKIIKFWKHFNQGVRTYNPRAYTIGELTNATTKGVATNRFRNSGEIESKFIQEAGFTTQTNYSYFYMSPHELYGSNTEGKGHANDLKEVVHGKLMEGWAEGNPYHNPGFLFSGPIDNIFYSHVSMGNHDKPRLLHMYGLAPDKFLASGSWQGDKAGAMADSIRRGIEETLNSDEFKEINEKYKDVILSGLNSLEKGKYKFYNGETKEDRIYNEENFGARPFDINIDDMIKEAKLQNDEFAKYANGRQAKIDKFKAEVLKVMLQPAMEKYKAAATLLAFLPGNPTNYAGDELGETGYETKCKNEFQQNRNRLHWERLLDENYLYVNSYKNELKNIFNLRGKNALSPLTNGHLVELDPQDLIDENGNKLPSQAYVLYRYNDKTDVIGAFHNYGFGKDNETGPEYSGKNNLSIDKIWLGKLGNVDENATYFNALNPDDKAIYKVVNEGKGCSIKKADGKPITFKNSGIILARVNGFK